MNQIMSPKWWINQFITVFMTMVFIYIIKKVASTYSIPVVSTVAEAV